MSARTHAGQFYSCCGAQCAYCKLHTLDDRAPALLLTHPQTASSYSHPFPQRMRSFVEMACGDGEILAHAFLVAGAVQWLAWQFRSAHIFSLIGGILLTGPCIGDVAAALESSTLQYTDACSVLAAQVQLDMQAPPTGPGIEGAPGVSGVMDRVLMAQPTRRHPEPRTYIEAAQHFVPAVAAKFE